jgi:hypothetical protein
MEALTIFTVDVNFEVKILILATTTGTTTAASASLLDIALVSTRATYSLRLISISRVSLTGRGGEGGAGGGGGVGERARSTPERVLATKKAALKH